MAKVLVNGPKIVKTKSKVDGTVSVMLHIKPTADRADLYRFKSNFIRLYREVKAGNDKGSATETLLTGVGPEGGFSETAQNAAEQMREIISRHTIACRKEVVAYLENAAKQLDIPL